MGGLELPGARSLAEGRARRPGDNSFNDSVNESRNESRNDSLNDSLNALNEEIPAEMTWFIIMAPLLILGVLIALAPLAWSSVRHVPARAGRAHETRADVPTTGVERIGR